MSIKILFFVLTAIVGIVPTVFIMRKSGKKLGWWKGLTLYGKVYIVLFVSFLGVGIYLTYIEETESRRKETLLLATIKSDSISMANLTVKVTKLYTSDSAFRSAIAKGGFKYDSVSATIINPKVNVEKGGSAVVNYAQNHGLQAGRDINLTLEKIWSDQQVTTFLLDIKKFAIDNRTNKVFFVLPVGVDKYNKVIVQLVQALSKNGYEVIDMYTTHFGFAEAQYDFELNGNVIQVNVNRL